MDEKPKKGRGSRSWLLWWHIACGPTETMIKMHWPKQALVFPPRYSAGDVGLHGKTRYVRGLIVRRDPERLPVSPGRRLLTTFVMGPLLRSLMRGLQ